MTLEDIKKIYSPILKAVFAQSFFSKKIINTTSFIVIFIIIALSFTELLQKFGYLKIGLNALPWIFMLLASYIKIFCFDMYLNSRSLIEIDQELGKHFGNKFFKGSYLLSDILYHTKNDDIFSGLIFSQTGNFLFKRLSIEQEELLNFYSKNRNIKYTISDFTIENPLLSYIMSIYNQNEDFKNLLFAKSINQEDLVGTIKWIVDEDNKYRRSQRFWSKENLSKIPSFGTDWSNSKAFTLEKYAVVVENYRSEIKNESEQEVVNDIENILSKNWQSNVLILGNDPIIKRDLILDLRSKIVDGSINPNLKDKIIYILQTHILLSEGKDKYLFEEILITILNEIIKSKNIILVIEDFPSFVLASKNIGTDIVGLLDPYLDSNIQFIATSPVQTFHQIIEKEVTLMEHFEIVRYDDQKVSILGFILDKSNSIENQFDVFFTWQAVKALDENVNRFFLDQSVIDKSIDILTEIPVYCSENNKRVVKKEDVEKIISKKVDVPIGTPEKNESDILLHLEEEMRKRIVGQKEAIRAISDVMIRQRSGIGAKSKPIGSFLFIGPTGVGKTETAKTLANLFFKGEDNMLRLDMSEFSSDDSIKRLIGSFDTETDGVLVNKIKENPYSVLLLDEFEKATRDVHNLFLQIIDEGFFSDYGGKRINCKNLIIIATSNAGNNFIWDVIEKGENLMSKKDEIVDKIIENNMFTPELLNRFDDIILFHPLSKEDVFQISKILLGKTAGNLRLKGIKLEVDDVLIEFVSSKGFDKQFGARPIKRLIQDSVEKIIAERIISGKIKSGETVKLTKDELEKSLDL